MRTRGSEWKKLLNHGHPQNLCLQPLQKDIMFKVYQKSTNPLENGKHCSSNFSLFSHLFPNARD